MSLKYEPASEPLHSSNRYTRNSLQGGDMCDADPQRDARALSRPQVPGRRSGFFPLLLDCRSGSSLNTQGLGAQLTAAPNPRRACAKHGSPGVTRGTPRPREVSVGPLERRRERERAREGGGRGTAAGRLGSRSCPSPRNTSSFLFFVY